MLIKCVKSIFNPFENSALCINPRGLSLLLGLPDHCLQSFPSHTKKHSRKRKVSMVHFFIAGTLSENVLFSIRN